MKLFEMWRKQKEEQITNKLKAEAIEKAMSAPEFKCDIAAWHYYRADAVYRLQVEKTDDAELEDDEVRIIWKYASNHIAYFITWLINHDYYNFEETTDEEKIHEIKNAIIGVKQKKITGFDFLLTHCKLKLYKKDIKEGARSFVDSYYNEKFKLDYKCFVQMSLGKEVNGIEFLWDEYEAFSGIIDIAFENHKLRNK